MFIFFYIKSFLHNFARQTNQNCKVMKNFFFVIFACIACCMPVSAQTEAADDYEEDLEEICLYWEIFDETKINKGPHRTPPMSPMVYYIRSTNKLKFAEPISECIIELVDVETDETVFALPLMYGVTQVQLPHLSSGLYRLKLIRSAYLFTGYIEI